MRLTRFLRMSQWALRPPSAGRVKLVFSVIAICLALALLEWSGILPDGLGLATGSGAPKIRPLP